MSPRPALILSAIFALLASSNTFAQRTGASSNSVSQDSAKTATVSFNQTAALTTDREVYPPEALVNIYGSGYLPGEPVSLSIKYQDSLFNGAGPDFSVSAVADTSGQFEVSWTIPADGGISDTLILQGLGALSGRMAGTVVHTANTILNLTILASDTLCPAGTVGAPDSFVVRANLAQFCSKEVTANLAGREILFFLNPGDCGVEIAQMSQDSALTDADGNAFVTFATPPVQGKYSVRAKFREEARPKPCPGTGNSACITEPGNSKRCMKLSKSNDCLRFVVMQDACPRPPKLVCPPNELITLCGPAEVCISPLTVDSRAGSAVTISLSFGELRGDSICFLADTAGVYVITAIAMDSDGNADTCQSVITVKFNSPPDIIGGGRTFNACFPGALINHDVNAVDLDGDTLIWSLSSGFGAINQSGLITFTADTSGAYCFTVRVDDICGFTEEVICLTVLLDQLPRINEFIDTVRACPGDSLCVTVTGSDPDIGDQLDIVQLDGPGVFLMNTDTSGVTCFQVGQITEATTYTFKYRITDNCLRDSSTAATPRPPIGTVTVTVITPRPLTVTLPDDFTSSQCAPEQICVDVSITDPDHNLVAVNTNFGIYNPNAGTVCYTPIGSGVDTLIVATVDSCGGVALDSVVITVVTAPTLAVTCPADTSIFICDSGLVCVPFGIFPAGVTVTLRPASASYNPVTGDICFFTNCSVRKQLTAIVDNGCAADTCNFVVDVTLNSSPFVITRPQLEIDLCQPGTVCWPAGIIDVDDNIRSIVVTPAGAYNSITGKICFPVDSSAIYRVIVTVADSCGAEGVDTTFLNAHVNSPPEINGGSDLALSLCAPQEVCVQFIAGDIDGAPPLVTTNIGVYNGISNIICFVPDTAGVYAIIGTATDSCGASDADTVIVTVSFNQPPLVILGSDTTITLCNLSQLCLPVIVPAVPGNDNLQSVISNTGFYNPITREICFTPGAAGVNEIILTATDACGVQSADTILITIIVNDTARISCPAGPVAIDVCGQDSVFYPLEITPSNARVTVQGANYSGGILSFAADTSGTYLIHVSAASDCGSDSCDIVFNVRIGGQISLNCPVDTSVFICNSGQTIFIPVGLMVDSSAVTVTPIGFYRNGSIGFSADTAGIYSITVLVDNACGTASCSFTVNTAINSAPSVQVAGKAVSLCSAGEIALPISVADTDGNIRSVSSSIGTIDGDTLRFTPPGAGEFTALVTVVDSCGLSAVDTALITVAINTGPAVDLGPDTAFALCAVDSVCLPVTFTDADNNIDISSVTVIGGTFAAGRVCFLPTGSGPHTIILSVSDSCGAAARDTVVIDVDINAAPVVTLAGPGDTSLCAPASICLAGTVSDNNLQSVTSVGGAFINGSICFTPDTSGAYTFVLSATDSCGVTVSDTEIVNVFLNLPPVVAGPQDTNVIVCDAGTICFALDATDPDGNILSIIASGARNALYSNGAVCFDPDSSGVYVIVILATDSCGQTGSDTVNVTVITNSAPQASFASDSLVVQCVTDSVCIPVAISDTDGNIAAVTVLGGSFNEQTGNVCFLPTTSGVFVISLSVIDSCGLSAADSLFVSVNLGEVVTLVCPSDTALFICEPDTLCFPISGIPAGAEIVVSPSSGWYDEASRQICFYTNCSVVKNLSIVVTNGCFVDSCAFVVNVTMNSPPLVIAAPDTGAVLCGLQDVCLPVGISDADDNLRQVIVEPFGSYNPITGLACIPIDSSGLHLITITAIDSCGARGVDSVIINAAVNRTPNVSFGADSALFLCRPQEICIPVSVGDPDNNIFMVASSLGVYDNLAGAVCFTPGNSSAVYRLIVTAVDSCGLVNADTAFVTVSINSAPTLTLAADTSVFLCKFGEVCIPVSAMDIDGNFLGITTSPGASYDELTGEVCFIAAASVVIPITVTALDSCGAFVSKTINIDVTINSPPRVVAAADTVVSGCGISEVCFPVGISDADDNIAGVSVLPFGSYNPISGLVCVTPTDTGAIAVIISVVDSCGQIGADTTLVVVTIGPDVSIECPLVPFNVSLCGPDTVRQMITVNPPDAQVTTTFGKYANGQLVFFADTAGTYQISLIAQGGCGVDTCLLTFVVIQGQVPKFNCPVDTSIFLCAPAEICRPVGVLPDGANVTILPAGRYQAGMVCFDADTTGRYVITALAQTECGNDSCTFTVDVTINSAPLVTSLADTSALVCDLPGVQICRFAPVSDVDGNLLKVNVPAFATYDTSGQICFTPDTAGTYRLFVEAVDSCGVRVADTFLVEILSVAPALIICPDTVAFEFCFDITQRFGLDITPAEAIVSATGGTLLGADSIGFFFDTSGVYTSQIIAATDCGDDTCEFVVNAVRLPLPTITCPTDQNLFLCAPDTLCLPFSFSPPPAFVSVSAPAFISGDSVCIPLLNDTTLTVTLTSAVSCAQSSCSFTVTAEVNEAPVVTLGPDFSVLQCGVDSVCIPVSISDDENNVKSVSVSLGVYDSQRQVVCFLPPTVGQFCIEVNALDSCGVSGSDTVCVTIKGGAAAVIACPQGTQQASLCSADTIRLLVPISGAVDSVTASIGVYDSAKKEFSFFADTAGLYSVSIIAYAPCGNDTCQFDVAVDISPVPTLSCPAPFDTTICVSQTDSICITIGSVSSGSVVEVRPIGVYNGGKVCVPIDTPGIYNIDVIARTNCGEDSCRISFTVNDNNAPSLTLPSGASAPYCAGDVNEICIGGIFATDFEGDPLTITQLCGPGSLVLIGQDSAEICFVPTSVDSVYEFCIQVTDGCHTRTETFFFTVFPSPNCGLVARTAIVGPGSTFTFPDTGSPGPFPPSGAIPPCSPVGQEAPVSIITESFAPVAGFDILISYDASAVAFLFADPGSAITDWEFFTFNNGPFASCGVACPKGLLRLVAIGDVNDGVNHPPPGAFDVNGELVKITFLISQDQNLSSQLIPVSFLWLDCGDNAYSNPSGDELYLNSRIFSNNGTLIWDEGDDIGFPESARPPGLGAPDACLVPGAKFQPARSTDFYNGGICIIPKDPDNDRGDLNLNGISYEVADAVTYTNYFIVGLSAFKLDIVRQTAASDVNADGQTLTIADLVFLIRVLIGDQDPIPKVVPGGAGGAGATVSVSRNINSYSVIADVNMNIGGAVFTFEFDGAAPESISLASGASNMDLRYRIEDGRIRALIFERAEGAHGAYIAAGRTNLLTIHLPENYEGEVRLLGAELADERGWSVINARIESGLLPRSFGLGQNYPNPFNPVTKIELALPRATQWTLTVYNMLGQRVRRFDGEAEAGVLSVIWDGRNDKGRSVASGVYLYQVKAGAFAQTKKMMLLK